MAESAAPLPVDDHRQGYTTNSPLSLLVTCLVCIVAFFIFSELQITSTEQAVLGLLAASVTITPGMTAQQMQELMAGSLDHYQTIASAIGWAVQIYMLMIAFPADRAFLGAHKKYDTLNSASLARSAEVRAKIKKGITIALISLDVITDFYYVIEGHTLTNGTIFGFLPDVHSAIGVLIVGVFYPVAICGITVYCGLEGVHRLDALLDRIRAKA